VPSLRHFFCKKKHITKGYIQSLALIIKGQLTSPSDKMFQKSIKKVFQKNYADIKKIKYKFTNLKIPFGLMIINDRVINWVWGKRPTAIEIVSQQISKQYKDFFLEIWNLCK